MRTKKNPEIPMVPKMHLKNVEHQRDQYKIENEKLKEENKGLKDKEFNLIMENNDLITISSAIEQADDYIRGENEKLERENEKLRKQYTTLTDHIRMKAENNPGVDRYIALVNFIDRLEGETNK